jgi:4-hydroxy-tetrahydrodipicolinate reductase
MLDVAVLGATGRMGRAVIQALEGAAGLRLCGALASRDSAALGRDAATVAGLAPRGIVVTADPRLALAPARVAIDFSVAGAVARHIEACRERGCALVLGVTGLDEALAEQLRAAAAQIAIVQSPNMSLGVNLCFALVARAARALAAYDAEVVDVHHRSKRDAPSGTALRFGELIAAARGVPLQALTGARAGARPPAAVGFSSLRAGDVGGEHTVLFAEADERVEITHRAAGRTAYAGGALAAARWVAERPRGLYGMHDVLGLELPAAD